MPIVKNKFDIIILSLTKDGESLSRLCKCLNSYRHTAQDIINKIYVVETNTELEDMLPGWATVIKPGGEFNYNKFFNIALEKCEAEFIFGPNNDLEILPGCLQTILKEFQTNKKIDSISPIDRNWHRHTKMYLPDDNKLYYGFDVSLHMFGCAWAARRSVFEKIGYLDEQFYFFYQDNDYIECLKACGLQHGVHTGARISHKSGGSNDIADKKFKYLPENMHIQGEMFKKKWWNNNKFKVFKQYST